MLTIEQADAAVRDAEQSYQEVVTRLDTVRARLNGTAVETDDNTAPTMTERLARLTEQLDPDAASKRLRAELAVLDDLKSQQWAALQAARQRRDAASVFLSTAEYVRKLGALRDAAEATRIAHREVEEEAARLIAKMLGGANLPRVRNPNEALLSIIAGAEHAIARCESTSGSDERKDNALLDLLNPFARMIRPTPSRGPHFDLVAVPRGKPRHTFFR